jgi:outer membrane protein TolC
MPPADLFPPVRTLLQRWLRLSRAVPTLLGTAVSAGTPWLLLGCAQPRDWMTEYGPPAGPSVVALSHPNSSGHGRAPGIEYVNAGPAEPPPGLFPGPLPGGAEAQEHPEGVTKGPAAAEAHPVPVSLDAVLRLAEEDNAQIALAREKLNESLMANEAAANRWLPKTYAGVAYYRHEGGIQNEMGQLVHSSTGALFPNMQLQTELDLREATYRRIQAERAVWQQKGELSKVTNKMLLEAATTYVDLLAARRGEAIAEELGKFEDKLLERARKAAKSEPSAQALVETLQAAVTGRQQAKARLRQQGDGASAKLAYLLGLGPAARLVPVDAVLAPIDLVDTSAPVDELVARALANGPGTQELEGLLGVIHQAIASAERGKYVPKVQLNLSEGAFAAGPGGTLGLDNRFDLGLQVRWDLSQLVGPCEQRRQAQSKLSQVHLRLADLHGQLAAGVREAYSAIVSGRQQIRWGQEQINHASEAYRISNLRVEEFARGATMTEVLQAIRALELAHLAHVRAVREHNKAQIRLLLLLGPGAYHQEHLHPAPVEQLPPPQKAT